MATPQPSANPLDLRIRLQEAKAIGQLEEVEGADLKFELGAITEKASGMPHGVGMSRCGDVGPEFGNNSGSFGNEDDGSAAA